MKIATYDVNGINGRLPVLLVMRSTALRRRDGRTLHPGERIYTFWDYFRNAFGRDAGLRIDHFMLSPQVAPRLVAAGVDRAVRAKEKTSDHAPVWIQLRD